jgi:hypothetical protein
MPSTGGRSSVRWTACDGIGTTLGIPPLSAVWDGCDGIPSMPSHPSQRLFVQVRRDSLPSQTWDGCDGSCDGYLHRFGMRLPRISAALRSDAETQAA